MDIRSESTDSKGGLCFTPPPDTIKQGESQGEGMVQWKKDGSGEYYITHFEGKPIQSSTDTEGKPETPRSAGQEIDSMDSGGVY